MGEILLLLLCAHVLTCLLLSAHVVLQHKEPVNQVAWILAMLTLPVVGLTLYLAIGTDRLRLQRQKRSRHGVGPEHTSYQITSAAIDLSTEDCPFDDAGRIMTRTIHNVTGIPPVRGNHCDLITTAEDYYARLEQAIEEAHEAIWIQTYVWRNDHTGHHFVDLLVRAANRGIEVRVMVDEIGSGTTPLRLFQPLRSAGGHFTWTNTLHPRRNRWFINLRNHRKIAIIDHERALVGGMNIGDEYLDGVDGHRWIDIHADLRGPIIAAACGQFAVDWHFATGTSLPSPDLGHLAPFTDGMDVQWIAGGPDHEPSPIAMGIGSMIEAARERLILTTPYFVPDAPLIELLCLAAARGVQVQLAISGRTDMGILATVGRSFFGRLIQAGVEIREYPTHIHHGKVVLIDDHWSLVGSINLDIRSMHLNHEAGILVADRTINQRLSRFLADNLAGADPLTLDAISGRSLISRLREGYLRLVAPLL